MLPSANENSQVFFFSSFFSFFSTLLERRYCVTIQRLDYIFWVHGASQVGGENVWSFSSLSGVWSSGMGNVGQHHMEEGGLARGPTGDVGSERGRLENRRNLSAPMGKSLICVWPHALEVVRLNAVYLSLEWPWLNGAPPSPPGKAGLRHWSTQNKIKCQDLAHTFMFPWTLCSGARPTSKTMTGLRS